VQQTTDLDSLEALARSAGAQWWQQGQMLYTNETQRWTEQQQEECKLRESKMLFSGFTAADQGRSRQRVATFETPEAAAYAACANPAAVLAMIVELKKTRNLIKEMDLMFGRTLLAMRCAVIEWEHGKGAKEGMSWIYNTLRGPGELPPEDAIDAQAHFDKEIVAIEQGLDEAHKVRESLRPKPLNPA
jgi:hypothetical protein